MYKILITGKPRIGKTTLILDIIKNLERNRIKYSGFWTEEIRKSGNRVGFQVVTTTGTTCLLAHIKSQSTNKVGKYNVFIEQFERIILPDFLVSPKNVIIIDEIGTMELFSKKFEKIVTDLFVSNSKEFSILATIGLKNLNHYRNWKDINSEIELFELEIRNYDAILNSISQKLVSNR